MKSKTGLSGFRVTSHAAPALSLFLAAALWLLVLAEPASAAPPANDNFANAQTVSGSSVSVGGTNVQATRETGEPNVSGDDGGSVWYRWTAPASGPVGVDLCTASYDTTLGVYTGGAVASLTTVAQNDDTSGCGTAGTRSRVDFQATSGTTYYIYVGGYSSNSGTFTLALSGGPANDDFAAARTISGIPLSTSGSNALATRQAGEPRVGTTNSGSVWYRWTAPRSGRVQMDLCAASFDTVLGVYTGGAVDALTPVATNDESPGCGTANHGSRVVFEAQQGTAYNVYVSGYNTASGTFTLRVDDPPPVNDRFADALVLGGERPAPVSGTTSKATREAGEPSVDGTNGASVWYRWTAPLSGLVQMDLCDSDFDTVLGVYTGSAVDALTPVATNDDTSGCGAASSGSRVVFETRRGVVYNVYVSGYNGGTGNFRLATTVMPPTNDLFANARVLNGGVTPATAGAFNAAATVQPGEPDGGVPHSTSSTWHRWTAPFSGPVSADLCDSDFDTVLGVYTGGAVDALTPVAADDDTDGCGEEDHGSSVLFDAISGTTYYLRVAGDDAVISPEGSYTLRLADAQAPVPSIAGPEGPTNTGGVTFDFSATDNATPDSDLRYSYKLVRAGEDPEGVKWSAYSAQRSLTVSLPEGSYNLHARVRDLAGNRATAQPLTFTVDTTAPSVESVSPPDGRTRVSPTTNITLTFSEAVDPLSLAGDNLRLTNTTKRTSALFALEQVAPNRFVLDPKRKLVGGSTYAVEVSTGARDRAGNPLAAPFSSLFVVKK